MTKPSGARQSPRSKAKPPEQGKALRSKASPPEEGNVYRKRIPGTELRQERYVRRSPRFQPEEEVNFSNFDPKYDFSSKLVS
ncbi:MAG TPA: hypothetical protein VFV34_29240, partial [Blastocatellia bacterium]|nr:hypothetical protein [Blastocatellia bacterium]